MSHTTFERVKKLLTGDVSPRDVAEKAFVTSYNRAQKGDLLINLYKSFPFDVDEFNAEENEMFHIGYALGQQSSEFEGEINEDDYTH